MRVLVSGQGPVEEVAHKYPVSGLCLNSLSLLVDLCMLCLFSESLVSYQRLVFVLFVSFTDWLPRLGSVTVSTAAHSERNTSFAP